MSTEIPETKTEDSQEPQGTQEPAEEPQDSQEPQGAQEADEEKMSAEELRLKIRNLKSENKEKRKKIAEYENEKYEQRKKEMKQKGKTDELNKELEEKVKDLESQATKWAEYEAKRKTEIKTSLTKADAWIDSFDKLNLSDLEDLSKKFKKDSDKSPTDSSNKFTANKNGKDDREPWEKMMSTS